VAAQAQQQTAVGSDHDSVRDREISIEQEHLDRVYRRLEEKIHEAEFLMNDAAKRGQVGTPGALAERDAQVFRAGIHLNRLNNEFEDFLFGRIDLLLGKDGKKGPDGAYTAVEPAEGAVRDDDTKGPLKCSLIAVGKNGERETMSSWSVPKWGYGIPNGKTEEAKEPLYAQGGAAFKPNEIDHFEVMTFQGKKLVEIDA